MSSVLVNLSLAGSSMVTLRLVIPFLCQASLRNSGLLLRFPMTFDVGTHVARVPGLHLFSSILVRDPTQGRLALRIRTRYPNYYLPYRISSRLVGKAGQQRRLTQQTPSGPSGAMTTSAAPQEPAMPSRRRKRLQSPSLHKPLIRPQKATVRTSEHTAKRSTASPAWAAKAA